MYIDHSNKNPDTYGVGIFLLGEPIWNRPQMALLFFNVVQDFYEVIKIDSLFL